MSEVRFLVPGMTCGHCVNAVSTELSSVPGVETVEVDLETKTVVVIDEAGYEAVGLS